MTKTIAFTDSQAPYTVQRRPSLQGTRFYILDANGNRVHPTGDDLLPAYFSSALSAEHWIVASENWVIAGS